MKNIFKNSNFKVNLLQAKTFIFSNSHIENSEIIVVLDYENPVREIQNLYCKSSKVIFQNYYDNDFKNCNFINSSITLSGGGCGKFENIKFINCKLYGLISGTEFINCKFINCDFSNIIFAGCVFNKSELDLSQVVFFDKSLGEEHLMPMYKSIIQKDFENDIDDFYDELCNVCKDTEEKHRFNINAFRETIKVVWGI